ncbi:YtxH domain-containing protein [Rhodococcus opacus]|uniref:YtxH domain-containing protein n=1 Tax=Rhodococcus opacus TaxID=37919 RepID=A0A2S8I763_RHOOP|nr:YtxH domain-containing protein [Rhodococcus opacus]PQP10528.1 hypothetical protein C5613_43865 [Rhodococcus opacus]
MEKAWYFAAGAAVGFVLGTRFGRQTYEKMRDQSLEAWHNPTVQEKVGGATETVKEKAPKVQQKVGALAQKITHHGADGTDTSVTTAPTTGVPLEEAPGPAPAAPAPAVTEPTPPTGGKHTSSPN